MKPVLALSTAWNSARHTDGYAMLKEAADLGFSHVELSHGIRITLAPGILQAVNEGVIKVSSLHNFCPLPTGITQAAPNLFEPSAADGWHRERAQWIRHTRRTLDFAVQVKAPVVVLHLGSVRFLWREPGRPLRRYARRHRGAALPEARRYQKLLDRALTKLREQAPRFRVQTQLSLEEILPYAAEKGVRLGLENRERFEELPLDADFPELLEALAPSGPAGYWHDTGHAELKERMGVITQRRLLEDNAARLVGFHLHDVDAEGRDHRAIGKGRVDFAMVRQFWQPHHLLVLELHHSVSLADVADSKRRIEDLM